MIETNKPTASAPITNGPPTFAVVISASRHRSINSEVSIYITPRSNDFTNRCQPSTETKTKSFTGSATTDGGNITIPSADKTEATIKSITKKGSKTKKPI